MHFSTLHYAVDDNKTMAMTLPTTMEALASAALYIFYIFYMVCGSGPSPAFPPGVHKVRRIKSD